MPLVGRQVTLKEVARVARCSTAVVSTVINKARGNTLVSDDMRLRVEQVARELGYRPNFASRSLIRRRTQTLGVYIPPGPWSGPGYGYESEMLRGVEAACQGQGYDLLLINLDGNQTPEMCLAKFNERRVDGIILMHAEPGSSWIRDLLEVSPNVVAVDYDGPEKELDAMVFDNEATGRVAVEFLAGLGHRRIGFLGSCRQPANHDGTQRQRAYEATMKKMGLPIRPEWIFDDRRLQLRPDEPVCQIEGSKGADHIISLGTGSDAPTAWIAYSDMVAAHAQMRLLSAGIRVPDQVSLIGVDDSLYCQLVTPNLTSIRHPLEQMGRRAAELLIAKSNQSEPGSHKSRKGVKEVFGPEVVARESTAPLSTR